MVYGIKPRYTLQELKDSKTISQDQTSDLKVEGRGVRVWLSRCTVADGEPYNNKVTVEFYHQYKGRWEIWEEYEAQ